MTISPNVIPKKRTFGHLFGIDTRMEKSLLGHHVKLIKYQNIL